MGSKEKVDGLGWHMQCIVCKQISDGPWLREGMKHCEVDKNSSCNGKMKVESYIFKRG